MSTMNTTWEKVLEYATSPLQGTLSRKQRKGVKIQINEGRIFENSVFFIGEGFVRVTEKANNEQINTYFDWAGIVSMRTYSNIEE